MTITMVGIIVAVAALFVRSRPEVALTIAALIIPAGSFYPSLRTATPIGQLTPFALTVLIVGLFYVATTPGALARGLAAAPGIVGVVTTVLGGVAAVAAWHADALYWTINGGLVLVLISSLLADRYRREPEVVERTVILGGLVLATSVLLEAALGRHLRWTATDPLANDLQVFRPAGLAGNCLLASTAIAVVLAIAVTGRTSVRFRLLVGTVFMTAIAVTLTRSAMIGAVLALTGFVFQRSREGRMLTGSRILILCLGIPTVCFVYLSSSSLISRRLDSGLANQSDMARSANLNLAWDKFLEQPTLGFGLGGFKRFAIGIYGSDRASLATTDNMFLNVLVELGIVGGLTFVAIAILLNMQRRRDIAQGLAAGSMVPLLVVSAVSLFFDSLFHECILYLFSVTLLMASPPRLDRRFSDVFRLPAKSHQLHVDLKAPTKS